jgi:integrase/recombinase XerD
MTAAVDMGLFMTWLKYTPANGGQVVLGPGAKPVRGEVRINRVLVAVRMFLTFAVLNKEAPSWVSG